MRVDEGPSARGTVKMLRRAVRSPSGRICGDRRRKIAAPQLAAEPLEDDGLQQGYAVLSHGPKVGA